MLVQDIRDRSHIVIIDVHDISGIEGDGDGAGGLILAQRGQLLQVLRNLLFGHALGPHLLAHLLFHASGGEDRADQFILVLQGTGVLEILEQLVDVPGNGIIAQPLAHRGLDDHGALWGAHGIGILIEVLHHLFLSGGGVHLRHGEVGVRGLGKAGGEANHRH